MASRQIALLRVINVGKAKRVAMADLRALFEKLGYVDVRTLLNSGNVVFSVPETSTVEAAPRIERAATMRPEDYQALSFLAAAFAGQGRIHEATNASNTRASSIEVRTT